MNLFYFINISVLFLDSVHNFFIREGKNHGVIFLDDPAVGEPDRFLLPGPVLTGNFVALILKIMPVG